jgi:hypothetical protein
MNEGLKVVAIMCATFLAIASMMLGYNVYTDAKRRDMYLECLKTVERINENADHRFMASTPTCWVR